MDVAVSFVLLLVLTPAMAPVMFLKWRKKQRLTIHLSESTATALFLFLPYNQYRWTNWYLLFWYVLTGKISLVGSPIIPDKKPHFANVKPGITGFRQLSETRLFHEDEKRMHELFYLQNYSIWLDFDVLLKTLIYRRKTLSEIDRTC